MNEAIVLSDEDQTRVDRGDAARLLLESPVFLIAIEAVRAQCAEAILTSPPQATQAREDAYHLARALSAVTVELDHIAAHGEQVLAQAEAISDLDYHDDVEHQVDY